MMILNTISRFLHLSLARIHFPFYQFEGESASLARQSAIWDGRGLAWFPSVHSALPAHPSFERRSCQWCLDPQYMLLTYDRSRLGGRQSELAPPKRSRGNMRSGEILPGFKVRAASRIPSQTIPVTRVSYDWQEVVLGK